MSCQNANDFLFGSFSCDINPAIKLLHLPHLDPDISGYLLLENENKYS